MVKNDDLSVKGLGTFGRIVLGITDNITSANFFDGNVLDVKANLCVPY
jgi:hypothetical protein